MRVLVVEDEVGLAAALRQGLSDAGYAVDVSNDGVDGAFRAVEYDYDVIVLDLMLPGLSGHDVVRRIRGSDVWTPILVLTARDGDEDVRAVLDLGADDYLTKPFSAVVLQARMRALIRRGSRERPAQLVVDDLVLDPATRQCRRGDDEVPLTTREFSVLHYLMQHAGRVVPKTELLDHVWDESFDGDPNIVEVYVGYLRRKIDQPFGRETIRTVRGAGYAIGVD